MMIFKLNTLVFEDQNISSTRSLLPKAGVCICYVHYDTHCAWNRAMCQRAFNTYLENEMNSELGKTVGYTNRLV